MNLIALMMLAADPLGEPLPEVVLLDFTASWCDPCQQMVSVIQSMEKDGYPIRKIDITDHHEISRRHGVDVIPTFILLVNGKETKRLQGIQPEDRLRQMMLNAREHLRQQKQKTGIAREQPPDRSAPAPKPERKRSRIASLFDSIRTRLSGRREAKSGFEFPTFRGQSPDNLEPSANSDRPMAATVRIRITDGRIQDVAAGTVLDSESGSSVILTCEHLFHQFGRDAVIEVDVFEDGRVLTYPADIQGTDRNSDLAVLQIQNRLPLPTVGVAAENVAAETKDTVFSIGCNDGNLPSKLSMEVVEINRYLGPDNIVCTVDPAHGRSGGGLFNDSGHLIGVCSCADRERHEGLYMGLKSIANLLTQLGLQHLLTGSGTPHPLPQFAEVTDSLDEEAAFLNDTKLIDAVFEDSRQSGRHHGDFATVAKSSDSRPAPEDSRSATGSRLLTAMDQAESESMPVEITVIVDSGTASNGKQVIVIPNPSPWLMQLLTGESIGSRRLADLRGEVLSATSAKSFHYPASR